MQYLNNPIFSCDVLDDLKTNREYAENDCESINSIFTINSRF